MDAEVDYESPVSCGRAEYSEAWAGSRRGRRPFVPGGAPEEVTGRRSRCTVRAELDNDTTAHHSLHPLLHCAAHWAQPTALRSLHPPTARATGKTGAGDGNWQHWQQRCLTRPSPMHPRCTRPAPALQPRCILTASARCSPLHPPFPAQRPASYAVACPAPAAAAHKAPPRQY